MPHRRIATERDIENFRAFGKTRLTVEEFKKSKLRGDVVEVEESAFNDPGCDYTAIVINGKRVGFWPGY